MEQSFGRHYLVEFSGCNPDRIARAEKVEAALLDAVELSGATYVAHHTHQFEPEGVSGVVLIAESHLSIHTWPEESFAAVDLFTCGESMRPLDAIFHLKRVFEADEHELRMIERRQSAGSAARTRRENGEQDDRWETKR